MLKLLLIIEHVSAVQGGASQRVLHRQLMFKNQQGNDIAAVCKIFAGVKKTGEVRDIRSLPEINHHLIVFLLSHHVSVMESAAMFSGHIPATPAVCERCPKVHDFGAETQQ